MIPIAAARFVKSNVCGWSHGDKQPDSGQQFGTAKVG